MLTLLLLCQIPLPPALPELPPAVELVVVQSAPVLGRDTQAEKTLRQPVAAVAVPSPTSGAGVCGPGGCGVEAAPARRIIFQRPARRLFNGRPRLFGR